MDFAEIRKIFEKNITAFAIFLSNIGRYFAIRALFMLYIF